MTTDTTVTTIPGTGAEELVHISAHHRRAKHLGYWTTSTPLRRAGFKQPCCA